MARCWTCGAAVEGNFFTCNSCKHLRTEKVTQLEIREVSDRLADLQQVTESGFNRLSEDSRAIADRLSELTSAVEWGFDAVVWQLQQQNETLQQIDLTLKTPTATQANEWREIAEDLSIRGSLVQAEEFYGKALSAYPLDYRSYLGLAGTYLKMNEFDRAKDVLEKSLPHAPSEQGFDWKSHSYRLLGHIEACREKYQDASRLLRLAINLSPKSVEAQYDNALYSAHTGDQASVTSSLASAIEGSPMYWRTAAVASDFRLVLPIVERIRAEYLQRGRSSHAKSTESARNACESASQAVASVQGVNSRLKLLRPRPNDQSWGPVAEPFDCDKVLRQATGLLAVASGAKLDDYIRCLEAAESAGVVEGMAIRAAEMAELERKKLLDRLKHARYALQKERAESISKSKSVGITFTIIAYFVGSLGGCMSRVQTIPGHPVSIFYPISAYINVGPIVALCVAALFTLIGIFRYQSLEPLPDAEDHN
jgi:tetratricopeptide (TPR) repeat protein